MVDLVQISKGKEFFEAVRFANITWEMFLESVLAHHRNEEQSEYFTLIEQLKKKEESTELSSVPSQDKPAQRGESLVELKLPEAEEKIVISLPELIAMLQPLLEELVSNLETDVDTLVEQGKLDVAQGNSAKALFREVIKPEQPLKFLADIYVHRNELEALHTPDHVEHYVKQQKVAPELQPIFLKSVHEARESYHKALAKPAHSDDQQAELATIASKSAMLKSVFRTWTDKSEDYGSLHAHSKIFTDVFSVRPAQFVEQSQTISVRTVSANGMSNKTNIDFATYSQTMAMTSLVSKMDFNIYSSQIEALLKLGVFKPDNAKLANINTPRPRPGFIVDDRDTKRFGR